MLLYFDFSQATFQDNVNSSIQQRCLEQYQTSEGNEASMATRLKVGLAQTQDIVPSCLGFFGFGFF